jgi:quinol-cytochrome oxidoreductase complex cytochrome b subunit
MSEKERKEIADRLQTAIILNRGCRFFSRKLEDYRKSRFTSFFYIVSFIALTVMSIIVFTFIYLALYKIQQNNFSFTSVAPSWFIFFYYSANTIFGQNINELIAAGTASRCMVLLERAFAFLLIIVLVSLVYSINSQRETEEINDAIKQIRGQGDEMESIIYRQYGFSITEAIAWLVSSNLASMIASKIIRYLSQFEEDIVKCENLDQSNED